MQFTPYCLHQYDIGVPFSCPWYQSIRTHHLIGWYYLMEHTLLNYGYGFKIITMIRSQAYLFTLSFKGKVTYLLNCQCKNFNTENPSQNSNLSIVNKLFVLLSQCIKKSIPFNKKISFLVNQFNFYLVIFRYLSLLRNRQTKNFIN